MYALMQGKDTAEWWLTDMATKRHMGTAEEAGFYLYVIRAGGGICLADANNGPQIWPQDVVDRIPRADINETNDSWTWWAATKSGPAHDVIKQATAT